MRADQKQSPLISIWVICDWIEFQRRRPNMTTLITVRIRSHERGLRFRYGDFRGILGPGRVRLWSRLWSPKRNTVEVMSTLVPRLRHSLLDVIVKHPDAERELVVIDLPQTRRALVWIDGRLEAVLGPGRAAYWKAGRSIEVETFDLTDRSLVHPRLEAILAHGDAPAFIESVDVSQDHDVLLFRNGVLAGAL